jgi:hypothetical protein
MIRSRRERYSATLFELKTKVALSLAHNYRHLPLKCGPRLMTGFEAKLERFESLITECELIAGRANESDRQLYLRANRRYRDLAKDMRGLITSFEPAA